MEVERDPSVGRSLLAVDQMNKKEDLAVFIPVLSCQVSVPGPGLRLECVRSSRVSHHARFRLSIIIPKGREGIESSATDPKGGNRSRTQQSI